MAISTDNLKGSPSSKSEKIHCFGQIFLRIVAAGATLSAACITFSNKQTTVVYGIQVDARYSYSPAFIFFAAATLAASAVSVLSLILVLVVGRKAVNSTLYFFLFVHDLVVTVLLMGGVAAALAISYVGKYGNEHTGWTAICDHFGKFCNRELAAIVLAILGDILYLFLTIISANLLRKISSAHLPTVGT